LMFGSVLNNSTQKRNDSSCQKGPKAFFGCARIEVE
jgi:hypothetical protein